MNEQMIQPEALFSTGLYAPLDELIAPELPQAPEPKAVVVSAPVVALPAGADPNLTMNDLFAMYAKDHFSEITPSTRRDYGRYIKHLTPTFGHRHPWDIQPREIGRYLAEGNGPIHKNKQIMLMSHVFTLAMGRWFIEGITVNPCQAVERNPEYPRTRFVTDEEFQAVYSICPFPIRSAMDLALLMGQRQADLLRMDWGQVKEDHIVVTQSKTGKHLGIRLTAALEEVLLRARRYKPFTPQGFRSQWQYFMDEAMKRHLLRSRWNFHDIRAKCASDKKNLQGASELLGHSDQGLTRRIYVRSIQMVDPLR